MIIAKVSSVLPKLMKLKPKLERLKKDWLAQWTCLAWFRKYLGINLLVPISLPSGMVETWSLKLLTSFWKFSGKPTKEFQCRSVEYFWIRKSFILVQVLTASFLAPECVSRNKMSILNKSHFSNWWHSQLKLFGRQYFENQSPVLHSVSATDGHYKHKTVLFFCLHSTWFFDWRNRI